MEIFVDSADLAEIEAAYAGGLASGVTTNPSLVAKTGGGDMAALASAIWRLGTGPISVEVLSGAAEDMVREGQLWRQKCAEEDGPNRRRPQLSRAITIKIPVTAEGLKAIRALKQNGIKTNATLVFSANQALLAARAGADYVSIFVGRLDDAGQNGIEVVREAADIFRRHNISSQVIAASIRNERMVTEAALAGSDIATVPYAILRQMVLHPLTEAGLQRFREDWERR
jgi:transaldolase